MNQLTWDAHFWRRMAYLGAAHGPSWLLHYSPPAFGLLAAALLPEARRGVRANLERVRGPRGALANGRDVAATFATYASSFAEGLASGSPNARAPEVVVFGELHLRDALVAASERRHEQDASERRHEHSASHGAIFATAHTAGWEIAGPLVVRELGVDLVIVMQPERDPRARELHDGVRRANGQRIVHMGDPLASLDLAAHLSKGGIVAMQVDRVPPGMRARSTRLFDADARIPEGPLRLARATGAPIVPVFCARRAFRRYELHIAAPIFVPKHATPRELDAAATRIADPLTAFIRAHPTQWLHFTHS